MNSSLSFGKAATQLLHFASPCPLILLFVTCPARNSSCPTLYLFFVALIETKTTCSYSQTMVGQGLCCVSLATQLLTRTVFFTFFARLRSPCKLCLPSHTLTTVSMKRRRCISLTNYSHGKGLKSPNIVRFFLFRSGRSSFDQCTGREKNYCLRTIMSKRTTTLLRLFQVSVNTNLQNKIQLLFLFLKACLINQKPMHDLSRLFYEEES